MCICSWKSRRILRQRLRATRQGTVVASGAEDLCKRYWGRHFWARGYFSTTSGNVTDDVILQYLQEHEPTGVSRVFLAEQGAALPLLLSLINSASGPQARCAPEPSAPHGAIHGPHPGKIASSTHLMPLDEHANFFP